MDAWMEVGLVMGCLDRGWLLVVAFWLIRATKSDCCWVGCCARYAQQRALQRAEALKGNVRVVKQQPTPVLALLLQALFSTQVSPTFPLHHLKQPHSSHS